MGDWAVAVPSDWEVQPEPNADAVHVGSAPTAADIGVAPANYTGPAKAAKPSTGTGQAFARGAVAGGTFGLFSVLNSAADQAGNKLLPQAALDFIQAHGGGGEGLPVNEPHTYEERRAAYQGLLHKAKEEHPYAFGAGEVAGTIAAPVPFAGSAGTAASKLGTKLGGKLLGGVAKAGTEAAIAGELQGAGAAAGEGKDVSEIIGSAEKGAGIGALAGVALHGAAGLTGLVAKKAASALQEKYVQLFGSEVLGNASERATKQGWAQILGKEAEDGVEQDAAKKFVQSKELAPVEAAAAKHQYEDAIQQIDQRLQKLSPGRQANYGAVNSAREFPVGEGANSIDKAIFKARNETKNPQALKALERAKEEWVKDFSSADAKTLQNVLKSGTRSLPQDAQDELTSMAANLPNKGRISRAMWADAAKEVNAGPDALKFLTDIEHAKADPKDLEGTFFKWDPKATIPAQELRAEATKRQQSAMAAFDTLMPQFNTETKKVVKVAINNALEKHLDAAAAGSPAAAAAVKRIRNDDVKFSVLLAAKQGLKEQLDKQKMDTFKLQNIVRLALHGGTGLAAATQVPKYAGEAYHDLQEGHYGSALAHGGEALAFGGLAGQSAFRGLSRVNNRLPQALSGLQAAANNPQAQALAAKLAARGITGGASPGMQQPQPPAPQPVTGTASFGTAGN